MNIVEAMSVIADKYHNQVMGQKRKYSGEPYTVHTDAVEAIYASVEPCDLVGRAIAKGHDLIEDTPATALIIRKELADLGFGPEDPMVEEVITGIVELTDVFTKENYPKLNRATRKQMERERLGRISVRSKSVKLSDLINNTASIVSEDKDFAQVYIREKLELLPLLAEGNSVLLNRASVQAIVACAALGIEIPSISAS